MPYRLCHDADIIVVHIAERLTASSLRHRLGWVKTHQDCKKPYEDLDMKGQMNVDAEGITIIPCSGSHAVSHQSSRHHATIGICC